jgi:phosphoribosylglycinamide formyltransferase-1
MRPPKFKLAIFASGSGTNAEAIMKHFLHDPAVKVVLLLSNNPDAYALERARKFHVSTQVFNKSQLLESSGVEKWLADAGVTHIILAGFLWLIPQNLLLLYPGRIINIHPALLPRFGGKGMYGSKVHEAVKASGETQTGITIHLVNEHFDEGKILFQAACPVNPFDTPEDIAAKVHILEHAHFPKVIEEYLHSNA